MSQTNNGNLSTFSRRSLLSLAAGTTTLGVAGCLGRGGEDGGNSFVLTTSVVDDPDQVERDFEPLVEWIADWTEVPTRIDPVQNQSAAIVALATGQAHAGYLSGGPAWVGWQEHGLEPIAVEVDAEGNTHYSAGALIHSESGIDSVEDLEGRDSCHTGNLTGAGMLIPMAHLAHEGLVTFEGDDVTAIRNAVDEFFDEPIVGGGYIGALQCLSTGQGEVAFVRTTTPEDYCGGDDPEDWCLDLEAYELLINFADVPSHPVMGSPEASEEELDALGEALLALNDSEEGRSILQEVLGIHGLTNATSREHLGEYGALLEILPGIEDHLVE